MPEFDICKGDEIQSKNYQINKIQKSIKKVAAQQIQKYACLSVNVASVIYFRAITNFTNLISMGVSRESNLT